MYVHKYIYFILTFAQKYIHQIVSVIYTYISLDKNKSKSKCQNNYEYMCIYIYTYSLHQNVLPPRLILASWLSIVWPVSAEPGALQVRYVFSLKQPKEIKINQEMEVS